MNKSQTNSSSIAWWVMRLTAYIFLGFYFTFDSSNYPGIFVNIVGIALFVLAIVDTFLLFRRIA